MTHPRTKKKYEIIEMQLEFSISHDRAEIALVCGQVVDLRGRITRDGFPLGHAPPIMFP